MPLCGATIRDKYLGHFHRCGLIHTVPDPIDHRCKEQEEFGECGYGWIDGIKTNAIEDWLDWGWRVDLDYRGPPIDTLERSTSEQQDFGS